MRLLLAFAYLAAFDCALAAAAEDGYDLWLRYRADAQGHQTLGLPVQELVGGSDPPTLDAARPGLRELRLLLPGTAL
jgi:hypothetical protein